jgi:hypothetical protein
MNKKITKLEMGVILFFLLVIVFILVGVPIYKKNLIRNHKFANAKIVDFSYGGLAHVGTITFIYNFIYNDKEIEGSAVFSSDELSSSNAKLFFVGKSFPVVYNPNNPDNNFLLIRPGDFKKFNQSIPDSLKWIIQYLHNR